MYMSLEFRVMKYFGLSIALICSLSFYSCESSLSLQTSMSQINFSQHTDNGVSLDFLKDFRTLRFFVSDKGSAIGSINRLFISSDKVYVLDNKEKRVLAFDNEGNFVQSTERLKGKGPCEYVSIVDAAWDSQEEKVCLLCDIPSQILILNKDLELEKSVALDFLADEVCVSNGFIYLLRLNEDKNELIACRKDNMTDMQVLCQADNIPGLCGSGKSLNCNGGDCQVCLPFDNKILWLEDGQVTKILELNIEDWFEGNTSPAESPREFITRHQGECWIVQNLCLTDSTVMFNTNLPGTYVGDVTQKKGGVRQMLPIYFFPIFESRILPVQGGRSTYYAYVVPASSIVLHKNFCHKRGIEIKNDQAKDLIESYAESDNPLVIMATMKIP